MFYTKPMKNVSVIFITDGRVNLLEQTLRSFSDHVAYPFFSKLIINDCVDKDVVTAVDNLSRIYGLTPTHHAEKRGFAGVYDTAFKTVSKESDYVFFIEDDFLFQDKINIQEMIFILQYNRNLSQVILKRQAWNESEKFAGGIIEQNPSEYEENNFSDIYWTEHRMFFSTNPCLVPYWIIERGWPLVPHSEGVFSIDLFRNPNYKSAFLGRKFDAPLCFHIGENRNGFNY
jgi:glycosyltransferase involved in cell wall biosynthesis